MCKFLDVLGNVFAEYFVGMLAVRSYSAFAAMGSGASELAYEDSVHVDKLKKEGKFLSLDNFDSDTIN